MYTSFVIRKDKIKQMSFPLLLESNEGIFNDMEDAHKMS